MFLLLLYLPLFSFLTYLILFFVFAIHFLSIILFISYSFLFFLRCVSTAKAIPKDKAIKRFAVRNIVDAAALRDVKEASAFDGYALPKLYIKQYYCVEAAVHQRIVRVRSVQDRRIRNPQAHKAAARK